MLISLSANAELSGTASLNCSGILVRMKRGVNQHAVLLTNGHCAQKNFIDPGTAKINVSYDRSPIFIHFGANGSGRVTPLRVLYATMTGTDIGLIELRETYRSLESKGATVYDLSDSASDSKDKTPVEIIAGHPKQKQTCRISYSVETLVDDEWTYKNALALEDPCPVAGGWFGAPLIDPTTKKIVGLLSSVNVKGGLCTLDNPCEVLSGGERLAFRGRAYAQRTSDILGCINRNGDVDLTITGCKLTPVK